MMELPEEFLSCFSQAVSSPDVVARFEAAMSEETPTCVRFNPSKIPHTPSKLPLAAFSESELVRIPWTELGFRLPERPLFTLDPLFHAGAYYVQDASSMFVGTVFRAMLTRPDIQQKASKRVLRVLDLCAAPGGKTTDLAASLRQAFGDNFLLLANEVVSQRAGVLKDNVCVWGDPNVVVSSSMPNCFSALKGFFDIILVDAPCSGEGMFRKEPQALSQWSLDEVKTCAERQKNILADVYPALAEDGYLLYSTCTYNRLENEEVVADAVARWGFQCVDLQKEMAFSGEQMGLEGEQMGLEGELRGEAEQIFWREGMARLIPGLVHGEGQFCALLQQPAASQEAAGAQASASQEAAGQSVGPEALQTSVEPASRENAVDVWQQEGMSFAMPAHIASEARMLKKYIKIIGMGVKMGEQKGKNWMPSEDWALNLLFRSSAPPLQRYCDYPSVELDAQTALKYLHGDSFSLPDAPQGTLVLTYQGLPIGFVKNLGSRCNNPRPKSRRIRMDIPTASAETNPKAPQKA